MSALADMYDEAYEDGYKEGYNKAIEEFAERCKDHILCKTFGLKQRNIEEIAEQLKGGTV